MTVFTTPVSLLPNNGAVRRPGLDTPAHRDALAGLAALDDASERRAGAEAYAGRAHDAENAELRATADRVLGALTIGETANATAIDRIRAVLGTTAPVKAVVSGTRLVTRPRFRQVFAGITILAVPLLAFAEAKLLSKSVVVSGILGLLPDSWGDTAFAWAFAALPLVAGLLLCNFVTAYAGSEERERAARGLVRWAKRLVYTWIPTVALVFGPHLLEVGQAITDPFAEPGGFADAAKSVVTGTQETLQHTSSLLIIFLIALSLAAASTVIAALLTCLNEETGRAFEEHVRDDETTAHCTDRIAGLLADQVQTAAGIGRLTGLVEAIAADRDAFALEVENIVENLRVHGEAAMRGAIRDAADTRGTVIDAGPLFGGR